MPTLTRVPSTSNRQAGDGVLPEGLAGVEDRNGLDTALEPGRRGRQYSDDWVTDAIEMLDMVKDIRRRYA